MYIFITDINFISIDKNTQVYDGVKSRKIERNYSIKSKITEGNLLNKQSKGYFKCKLTKTLNLESIRLHNIFLNVQCF